jgi:hypothetical protein
VGTTYLHAVAPLDGYIADERDDVGPLHDWYFNGDRPLVDEEHTDGHGTPFRVSRLRLTTCVAGGRARRSWSSGDTSFDRTNGWEGHRRRATTS